MEMEDLAHYMNGTDPIFPSMAQPQAQLQPPRDLHYAMVMLGGGGGGMSFGSDSTVGVGSSGLGGGKGFDMEMDGYSGRWLREETLTLLEIRSRLDSKFKEANQKGPLWDEVSRIMSVEHGYKRTGRKCCEKFENLYKYYRKIKDGKSGRQDKKHYRFFRHLDALYGETSTTPSIVGTHTFQPNPNPTLAPFKKDSDNKRRLGKKCWKTMITDSIETEVQTLMEKQEAWMLKIMKTIDDKENERISKEDQWRREEAARFELENKIRASERAWMESRDSALMEALFKLTSKESTFQDSRPEYNYYDGNGTVSNLSSHHNNIFDQPNEKDPALYNDGDYRVLLSDPGIYCGTKIAKGDDQDQAQWRLF